MIYIICDSTNLNNGWGTYSNQIVQQIENKNILIICRKKNPKLKIKQIEILSNPLNYFVNPFLIIKDAFKINKLIVKNDSIIHFCVEPYILLLPFLKNKFKKKICTFHGSYFFLLFSSKLKLLFKLSLKLCNQFVFVSNYTKKKINPYLKNIKKKNIVISNGISVDKFYTTKKQKKFNILCLSAIKPRKGQLNIIEVARLLKNKKFKFRLTLAGEVQDKNYFKKIKDRIKKYSLQNFISIKKYVSDKEKKRLFITSNLFILLSESIDDKFEGFGLVYLEALSYGLPVIISSESGASDLNVNKFNGLISKPKNYNKIYNAIIKFSKINLNKVSKESIKLCKKNLLSNRKVAINKLYT